MNRSYLLVIAIGLLMYACIVGSSQEEMGLGYFHNNPEINKSDQIKLLEILSKYKGIQSSGRDGDKYYTAFVLSTYWRQLIKYILVEQQSLIVTPGTRDMRIQLLSDTKYLGSYEFSLGWRVSYGWTTVRRSDNPQYEILEVNLRGDGNEANYGSIAREYFVISIERPKLIRLENIYGKLIRNRYDRQNYTIGIPYQPKTDEEVLQALNSTDSYVVLETLIWLGGEHADPSGLSNVIELRSNEDPSEVIRLPFNVEDADHAIQVSRLRMDPNVKAILNKLSESNNRWIREAAAVALNAIIDDEL